MAAHGKKVQVLSLLKTKPCAGYQILLDCHKVLAEYLFKVEPLEISRHLSLHGHKLALNFLRQHVLQLHAAQKHIHPLHLLRK